MTIEIEKIVNEIGGDLMLSADTLIDKSKQILSISPSIDIGLNGGIPEGSWVVLSGIPKTGKTTLALEILAAAQKLGRNTYYADIEYRLKSMNLEGCKDLDTSKLKLLRSSADKILSAEEYLNIIMNTLKLDSQCVVVIDSLAAMCTAKEMSITFDDSEQRAGIPKLLSRFVRSANQTIGVNKNIIICINHLGANVTGYGAAYIEKGGMEITYQADVRMQSTKFDKIESKDKRIIGQICYWKVLASALGPPFLEIPMRILYGHGIDRIGETLDLAIQYGFISKKGSWLTYEDQKWQGFENAHEFLSNTPELTNKILNQIKSLVFST